MSPSVLNKPGSVPNDYTAAARYLVRLGLDPKHHDPVKIWTNFNRLAREGYELGAAPTTMEMESLKVLGLFEEKTLVERFKSETEMRFGANGQQEVVSMSIIKGKAGGSDFFLNVDESYAGFLDAIYNVLAKTLKQSFGLIDPPKVVMYHVDSFRRDQSTAAPTRVTIGFSNGMATQYVHTNQVFASFMALKAGFEMDLRQRAAGQALKLTGTQPR